MPFFDPDRNWKSADKLGHLLAGFITCGLADLIYFLPLDAALVTLLCGVAFELGQWDVAKVLPSQPGWGFGLLDLAADLAGIGLWLALAIARL